MPPSRRAVRQLKAVEALTADYGLLVTRLDALSAKLDALSKQVAALEGKLDGVLPKAEIVAKSAPTMTVRKR